MFGDPINLVVSGTTYPLPRIKSGQLAGTYRSADGSHLLTISHQEIRKTGRTRTQVQITSTKTATDPLSAEVVQVSQTQSVVFDRPTAGFFTATELSALFTGLATFLSAANITKLFGLES
jgi:hypothetical protein